MIDLQLKRIDLLVMIAIMEVCLVNDMQPNCHRIEEGRSAYIHDTQTTSGSQEACLNMDVTSKDLPGAGD